MKAPVFLFFCLLGMETLGLLVSIIFQVWPWSGISKSFGPQDLFNYSTSNCQKTFIWYLSCEEQNRLFLDPSAHCLNHLSDEVITLLDLGPASPALTKLGCKRKYVLVLLGNSLDLIDPRKDLGASRSLRSTGLSGVQVLLTMLFCLTEKQKIKAEIIHGKALQKAPSRFSVYGQEPESPRVTKFTQLQCQAKLKT